MTGRIRTDSALVDLWADRAVFGLDPDEERELARLEGAAGGSVDPREAESLELAAASVALLLASRRIEPLPAALRARLEGGARVYFAARASTPPRSEPRPLDPVAVPARPEPRRLAPWAWLAAAAAAAVAVLGWLPRERSSEPAIATAAPAAAELRAALLRETDTLRVEASGTDLAKNAGGDVVWQTRAQSGWMRLVDLPPNDPQVEQYQLWIFDEAQKHPVDGGVFNVTRAGEVLVPIDAKLRVVKPTLFAITIEKPGGVVVSDRERIAWVAKPI